MILYDQNTLPRAEREAALDAIADGLPYKYCPTPPGQPAKVYYVATREHVEYFWPRPKPTRRAE